MNDGAKKKQWKRWYLFVCHSLVYVIFNVFFFISFISQNRGIFLQCIDEIMNVFAVKCWLFKVFLVFIFRLINIHERTDRPIERSTSYKNICVLLAYTTDRCSVLLSYSSQQSMYIEHKNNDATYTNTWLFCKNKICLFPCLCLAGKHFIHRNPIHSKQINSSHSPAI